MMLLDLQSTYSVVTRRLLSKYQFNKYCHEHVINIFRPRQNWRHFTDDIFKYENVWIPIWISLKFVPEGQINNIPALVEIMGWRRLGDKPLSEPMVISLPTHICVTRPQWIKIRIMCVAEWKSAHDFCAWLLQPKVWRLDVKGIDLSPS